MEEKTYTVKEVIELTIEDLRTINVPADLLEQIGPPISRALGNLRNVLKTYQENEAREQAQAQAQAREESEEVSDEVTDAEVE